MKLGRCIVLWFLSCGVLFALFSSPANAKTLCVNPSGSNGCFTKIQDAVNAASPYDVVAVWPGTYKEYVTIGKPLTLQSAGGAAPVIDATNLPHGIFVDGFDNAGLDNVTITGFTVENAQFEGIVVVSASDVTIRQNSVINNDKSNGLEFTGDLTGCPSQPGDGTYENDETGDCGGAIHLIGTTGSTLDDNFITGNADGVLISDETAESRDNLLIHNTIKDNPLECGIVLASHPPMGHTTPSTFTNHFGVDHNTVADNVSTGNGVQIGGAGVGMFSDGAGPGRVSGNVVIGNTLIGNGLGGVALHTHVGPAIHLPADDMSGNMIIGNSISGNLADQADTATPGPVGININSGGGGSPVLGTVISHNVITDEDVDIAINTPAEVDIHLNDLLDKNTGIADVCSYDHATICTGAIDATDNYWGCPAGPGAQGCSMTSGTDILFTPWLRHPLASEPFSRDRGFTPLSPLANRSIDGGARTTSVFSPLSGQSVGRP